MNSSLVSNSTIVKDAVKSLQDAAVSMDAMATAKKMNWVSSSVLGPLFIFMGIIGNVLSLKIWQKKSLKSSTGNYLSAQSVNDIGVLLFFFFTDSIPMVYPAIKTFYWYGTFFAYVGYPMFYIFVVNSIWTLVGVTVDRYIQVCWANQAKTMCRDRAVYRSVAIITLISFTLNSPHFNTYYAIPAKDRAPDSLAFAYTEFGSGKGSQLYQFWVHCMFMVLVPWVTILTMNLAIIRRVSNVTSQAINYLGAKAQDRATRKENQMTLTLLTVTFTFLTLIALQCVTQCFFDLKPAISDMRIVNEAFSIAKLGIIINSSVNFLLYCMTGERFRRELRLTMYEVFGCLCLVQFPPKKELPTVSTVSRDESDLSGGVFIGDRSDSNIENQTGKANA